MATGHRVTNIVISDRDKDVEDQNMTFGRKIPPQILELLDNGENYDAGDPASGIPVDIIPHVPDYSTEPKAGESPHAKKIGLKPIVLNDAIVYDLARHYYTSREIAERFGISVTTLMEYHKEAFWQGHDDANRVPRIMLGKIIADFNVPGMSLARRDVPTHNLIAAIELHARMYCGLGTKQEITLKAENPLEKLTDQELQEKMELLLAQEPKLLSNK